MYLFSSCTQRYISTEMSYENKYIIFLCSLIFARLIFNMPLDLKMVVKINLLILFKLKKIKRMN